MRGEKFIIRHHKPDVVFKNIVFYLPYAASEIIKHHRRHLVVYGL